jgi:hypothetical protein
MHCLDGILHQRLEIGSFSNVTIFCPIFGIPFVGLYQGSTHQNTNYLTLFACKHEILHNIE